MDQVTFDRDDDFVRAVADHLASRFHEATAQDQQLLATVTIHVLESRWK